MKSFYLHLVELWHPLILYSRRQNEVIAHPTPIETMPPPRKPVFIERIFPVKLLYQKVYDKHGHPKSSDSSQYLGRYGWRIKVGLT
ncbi:MAG: hypothetical protein HC921_18410 [Synechococcaceae cyanobacterium SM2_3_1]|nr:hypothetical protein [Synechococcaceae cyanobacterium SM2_3_1]